MDLLEIVQRLHLPAELGVDMDSAKMPPKVYDQVHRQIVMAANTHRFTILYGLTKMVIVFQDCDDVLKVPFNGYFTPNWDQENDDEPDMFFDEFENACNEDATDYCMDEWLKYLSMKEAGFAQFAAPVDFLWRDRNGRAFYKQVKCKMRDYPTVSEDSRNQAKHLEMRYDCAQSVMWMAAIIEHQGLVAWKKFVDWADENCEDRDDNITADLHGDNCGYMGDVPVIVDLSGYREC